MVENYELGEGSGWEWGKMCIRDRHNYENVMAAVAMGIRMGVPMDLSLIHI